MDALDAMLKANDLVAVLGREVPVRLVDISGSGCLLESSNRLEKGTTGALRVMFDGLEYADDVRIMRCRPSEGRARCITWARSSCGRRVRGDRSLRRVLASLQGSAVKAGRFETPKM